MPESPSITIESNYLSDCSYLAGTDEVGRGPLAGPVVAATVMASGQLSDQSFSEYLNYLQTLGVTDSKKLSHKRRQKILTQLNLTTANLQVGQKLILLEKQKFTIYFALAEISPLIIDQINILNAALLAMSESFLTCWQPEEHLMESNSKKGVLLVDGQYPPPNIPPMVAVYPTIRGDSKSQLIALASIIAKEFRDHLMGEMAKLYPDYGFEKHAGYPTKYHKEALTQKGVLPIHRKSFKGVSQLVTK